MRNELNEQVQNSNQNKNDQMAKDRLYMASLTQKALEKEMEEKKKQDDMKRKLQEINKERSLHQR